MAGDTLLLRCEVDHTWPVIDAVLAAAATEVEGDGRFRRVRAPSASTLVLELAAALTPPELRRVRALLYDPGRCDPDRLVELALGAPDLETLAARVRHGHLSALVGAPDRFHSRYQPVVDLGSRRVVAYEALLRARDDHGRELPAASLFGAAAAGGWTDVLDRIGRETAITQAASWLGQDLRLFINFIPTSIYRPEICLSTTMRAAERAGVDLGQLVFEVVESHRTDDPDHLLSVVEQYRARGAGVALDDVGSGYSSLALVARLRPDVVKLDMELVQRLPDPTAVSIVRSIIDLAHGLGAAVVAEGVETEQQATVARELGADLGQGWLFGRPALPVEVVQARSA